MLKKSKEFNFVPRIFLAVLLAAVSLQAAGLIFLAVAPQTGQAANLEMNLEVPIPGLNNHIKFGDNTAPIAQYIKGVYTYAIGIVGILAAVVLMIGGLMWITAGGNASSVGEAKAMITASLTGLILALTSYLLLSQVNPALVNLRTSIISPISNQTPVTPTVVCDWTWGSAMLPIGSTPGASGKVISEDSLCAPKPKPSQANPQCSCEYKKDPYQNCSWSASACPSEEGNTSIPVTHETAFGLSPTGNLPAIKSCGSAGFDGASFCCCSPFGQNWTYQNGIAAQAGDASPELNKLIDCLKKKITGTPITINSISDSKITPGGQSFSSCRISGCAHTKNSCHYGGTGGPDRSYAVDLGGSAKAITDAAYSCPDVKLVKNEGNHIHISVLKCQSDQSTVETVDQ